MDFFDQQDRARRMTWRLVGLLFIAMTLVVLVVYAVAVLVEGIRHIKEGGLILDWSQPRMFLLVALATVGLVSVAAWMRIRALDAGGGAVALALGGRQVLRGRGEGSEGVLLNVVEEMAIAAGMPVPFVFILDDEAGINAMAAATQAEDAAVVVTSGALERLSRDELQAVIGHEFSHLLNGDTRLNMRLVALLHGLMVLSAAGLLMLRFGARGSRRRRPGAGLWLLLVGAAVWLAGAVGLLSARLIKAAVSRQREYLADAAAVQFSRNPTALAGALKKIGRRPKAQSIHAEGAEEFSHLFFCEAFERGWLAGIFATHPPLIERIRRLEPGFRGDLSASGAQTVAAGLASSLAGDHGAAPAAVPAQNEVPIPTASKQRFALPPETVIGRVGAPTAADISWGAEARQAIPEVLQKAAAEPFDALATLFALLLQDETEARAKQEAILLRLAPTGVAARAQALQGPIAALDERLRLPLVETLMPALRRLSEPQRRGIVACTDRLAEADGVHSVFEYALRRTLLRRLLKQPQQTRLRPQALAIRPLAAATSTVLSALAWAGHDSPKEVGAAFRKAIERLPPPIRTRTNLQEREAGAFAAIDKALDQLLNAAPQNKKAFVDACAHCVAADGQVTAAEAELLRTVVEAIGCPLPALLGGQTSL